MNEETLIRLAREALDESGHSAWGIWYAKVNPENGRRTLVFRDENGHHLAVPTTPDEALISHEPGLDDDGLCRRAKEEIIRKLREDAR